MHVNRFRWNHNLFEDHKGEMAEENWLISTCPANNFVKGNKLQKYVYFAIATQTREDIDGLYAAITEKACEGKA